jgi:chemotaxis protein MotB
MSGPGGGTKIVYIKKKAKGHGHHGGAWKVAYADFVTAMMALFIVLWLLTQTDSASKEKIAQYFRTGMLPGGSMVHGQTSGSNPPMAINILPSNVPEQKKTGGGSGKGAAEAKALKELTASVSEMLVEAAKDPKLAGLGGHVAAKVVDEGALIELVDGGDNFLFTLASSDLKSGAVQFLQRLAPLLKSVPNKIEIHGHTDARRFGSHAAQDNWDLSFERANQARAVLEANGLPKGRIGAVLAHAENALYNEKDPYAAENRRLSILVVRKGFEAERQGRVGAPGAPPPQGKAPADDSTPKTLPTAPQQAPAEAPHGSKTAEPPAPTEHAPAPKAATAAAPVAAPAATPAAAAAGPKATVSASVAQKPFKKSSAKRSQRKAGSKP